ncbi:polyketide synthase Pks13 [Nocardia sp. NPDC101769]|uniref:polyketide synthase Pks13 n=1 Tax=Nocardia sp. NPDC101769 TaxID=3364333 RepID=UPI00382CB0E5
MADNDSIQTTELSDGTTADAAVPGDVQISGAAQTAETATKSGTELSVPELREWLRRWVADATGQPIEQITVDRPMEEFGLASRDALALGGDIEELTGVMLSATTYYQHPTIASLSERIINGETDVPEESADESFYTTGNQPTEAHDIALVGMSTRLPGAGDTPASTWEFLINGGDAIRELPEGRWAEFAADPRIAEAINSGNTLGGYLDQDVIKGFDAEFFAMSPLEVERVDPQQRLMMELTWEALEHARIPASQLKGESVGVYIGTTTNDFQMVAALGVGKSDPDAPKSADAYALTGSSSAIIANRISYFYDFRGPSLAVDTACSSTLVAVHEAVRALRDGAADLALAGGVNMILAPAATLGFDSIGMFAKNGRIKAFSSDADGIARSEGAGLVVLKRLADAERDGDRILAVIKGSAVNSDGRSNGLVAPNPDAQADVLRRAYRDAGIVPSTVDYIEAHGTGTLLGDPIEADALGRVVGRGRAADKPALLGSAKTNFGHMESAAGAASLAKVVMALQNNVIPPNINFAGPNPYIPFDQAHLKVVDTHTEFPRYSGTATVGISGMGFGGTNAHVVIQEYVPTPAVPGHSAAEGPSDETADAVTNAEATVTESEVPVTEWTGARTEPLPMILAVSAYLPSRRRRAATDLADWLASEAGQRTPLDDVARSLAKRNHGRSRGVVLATTHEEAIIGLRAIAAGKPGQGVFTADAPAVRGPMWVFGGFGSHHRTMGKQLYLENSIFARTVDEVDELVQDEAGYSVKEMILDDDQDWDVGTSQVGVFTIQIGLAALLRAHGAEPEAVVGHSQGEAAASYVCGGMNLADAVRVICARSRLMAEGEQMITDEEVRHMALVEYSAADIERVLVDHPDLEVAVYAAPTNTVIGGPPDQVQAVVARAEADGKFARVLQTRGAGHTSQVDPLLGELAAELAGIEPSRLAADLYSTVRKGAVHRAGSAPVHDVDYWVANMRQPVCFTDAIRAAVDSSITTYLEITPHPVALMQVLGTTHAAGVHNAALIPTLQRREDDSANVVSALAQLYVQGHPVNLSSLLPDGDYADIPRTAFLRKPYWPKVSIAAGSGSAWMPGSHVAWPDGRHGWEVQADAVQDLATLAHAAARQVLPDVCLDASIAHAALPAAGVLTTILTPFPGGAAVKVYAQDNGAFRLLFDAVVASSAPSETTVAQPVPAAHPVVTEATVSDVVIVEDFGERWNPTSTQTVEQRLSTIVAESMGYAVEDLPMEIPLMELGLDSLMAMRIKNRVEYEFDIPQLQIQAVRDASLHEVAKVLRYAIEHRDEVRELAAQQAAEGGSLTLDDNLVATARAAMVAGQDPAAANAQTVEKAETTTQPEPAAVESPAAADDSMNGQDNVPPRDAAERLTFGTWAMVTGKSAGGIFNTLPNLDDATVQKLAERLSERVDARIDADEVLNCRTIEQLAEIVRRYQNDTRAVDGFVRTLRSRAESSDAVPVLVFHPAGGDTLMYEPLLKRLPVNTPVYGFERVDGSIEDRARQYIPEIRKIQPEGPYVLCGWSLGAVLALQVGQQLRAEGADVRLIGLIDLAIPVEPEDDSPAERVARIERYQAFAKKTFNIAGELDREQLEELAAASDEEQLQIVLELVKFSGTKIPGGVLEHQRTSWIEQRELAKMQPSTYDGDVVLYLADRYHDGAIELEPRYANRRPNGGWDDYIPNLEVIRIPGDHLQIVDEPRIATIAADLTEKLALLANQVK